MTTGMRPGNHRWGRVKHRGGNFDGSVLHPRRGGRRFERRCTAALPPQDTQLAITRTGILCEAPYEIVAHKRIGKNVGVTDEQNEALENWHAASCFDDTQRAALAFTDEIVRLNKPTDATFKAIALRLAPAALVELQLSVGFYIMTSKFLETFEIDLQPVTEVVG